MAPAGHGQKQYQISFAEELGENKSLSGGTVTTNTVTGLSGMTAKEYSGQLAVVLDGAIPGRFFHVVTNTTTVLTFQENVATAGLTNASTLFFTKRNSRDATSTFAFKIGEDVTLPAGERELYKGLYAGTGVEPTELVHHKWNYAGSLPIMSHNLGWLYMIFGHEYTTGTDAGQAAQTITEPTYYGETRLTISLAGSFANDDYVQVGISTSAEVRKIASGGTTTSLVLDRPLRIDHADNVAIDEVVSPYTHNFAFSNTVPLPSFGIEWVSKAKVPNLVWHSPGVRVETWEVSATSESPVSVTLGYKACDFDDTADDGSTALSASTVVYTGLDTPHIFKPGNTSVAINGISYAQVAEWKWSGGRALKTEYFGFEDNGDCLFKDASKPHDHYPGAVTSNELTIKILVTNKNMWDLVNDDTSFTVTLPVSHPNNATLDNRFTLTFVGKAKSAIPTFLAEDGPMFYELKIDATAVTASGTDRTPYYLMGGLAV